MSKSILLFLHFVFTGILYSQNSTIAIYFDGEDILSNSVEGIVQQIENDSFKIKSVTNINEINLNREIQSSIYELISPTDSRLNIYNDADLEKINTINNQLINHDLFFHVKTKSIANFIQFSFSLYSTTKKSHSNTADNYHIPKLLKKIRQTDFLLDIKSEEKYRELTNEIIRIFPFINEKPTAFISTNSHSDTDSIFFWPDEKIKFLSELSSDYDTNSKYWKYDWRQINISQKPIPNSKRLVINKFASMQELKFEEPGIYYLGLRIFDGLEYSKEDTIIVNIAIKPRIKISENEIDVFVYRNAINSFKKKEQHTTKISAFLEPHTLDSLDISIKEKHYSPNQNSSQKSDSLSNFTYKIEHTSKSKSTIELVSNIKNLYNVTYNIVGIQNKIYSNVETYRINKYKRNPLNISIGVVNTNFGLSRFESNIRIDTNFINIQPYIQLDLYVTKNILFGLRFQNERNFEFGQYFFNDKNIFRPRVEFTLPIKYMKLPSLINLGAIFSYEPVDAFEAYVENGRITGFILERQENYTILNWGFKIDLRTFPKTKFPIHLSIGYESSFIPDRYLFTSKNFTLSKNKFYISCYYNVGGD